MMNGYLKGQVSPKSKSLDQPKHLHYKKNSFSLISLDFSRKKYSLAKVIPLLKRGGILRISSKDEVRTKLPLRQKIRVGSLNTFLFSEKPLPKIGPPLGSIVRSGNHIGRVRRILSDGLSLVHLKKSGGKWIQEEEWDVPFSSIRGMRLREPSLKKHVRRKSKRIRREISRNFRVGQSIRVFERGITWTGKVFKRVGLDQKGILVKYPDGYFEVFHNLKNIKT